MAKQRYEKKEATRKFVELSDETEIARLIDHLDQTARRFEAAWGVGRLPGLVPAGLQEKWYRQNDKFADALSGGNIETIRDMVNGMVRGWQALEAAAIAGGHKPTEGRYIEGRHPDSGRVYRIAYSLPDASMAHAEGVTVWTLEEIVRVLEGQQLVNVAKQTFPGAEVTKAFKGAELIADEVPW